MKIISATLWMITGLCLAGTLSAKENETVNVKVEKKYCCRTPLGDFYNARGLAQYGRGKFDDAIKDFTKAISLGPTIWAYLSNRGMAYNDKKEFDKAIEDLSKAIELEPHLSPPYICRGYSHMYKGDFEKAKADFDMAIKNNPKEEMAYNNRAAYYRLKEDYESSIADCDEAYAVTFGKIMGECVKPFREKKDFDKALLSSYGQMVERGDAPDYKELCWIYFRKDGATAETLKKCSSSGYWINWFLAAYKGDLSRAEEHYKKGHARGPCPASVFNEIGDFYNSLGNYPEALWAYKKALNSNKYDFESRAKITSPKYRDVVPKTPTWYQRWGK